MFANCRKIYGNASIPIQFMKRFLDDFLEIFVVSISSLHKFFEDINNMHPTIKFTMSHTTPESEWNKPPCCDCPKSSAIPFLHTLCRVKDGKILTDLCRKFSDRNQYLLPDSCHPLECIKSIPCSLSTRILRACSETSEREARYEDLRDMLISRNYTPGIIDAATRV